MTETVRPVVWIASYPKSGNTWLQLVIRRSAAKDAIPNTDLDIYRIRRSGQQPEASTCVSSNISNEPTVIAKTHSSFPELDKTHGIFNLRTVGFVYVMRNPLDLLLSYINFSRIQYQNHEHSQAFRRALFTRLLGMEEFPSAEEWANTELDSIPREFLDHALDFFTGSNTRIPALSSMAGGSWRSHCFGWLKAAATVPGVVMRYEKMLEDSSEFHNLSQLFEFSLEDIDCGVEAANARQRSLQGNNIFYNKMSSYYYPAYFSEHMINNFVSKFKEDLQMLGYPEIITNPMDPIS